MVRVKWLIILGLGIFPLCARSEYLELAETRLFYPQRVGITNLSFKLRIDGLDEYLKASTSLEKIKDIYFDVLWQSPGKMSINVVGINARYKELVANLVQHAHGRLALMFPTPLSSVLRSYKVSETKAKERITIKGQDETYLRDINSIEMITDAKGKLMESTYNYPSSQKKSTYKTSIKGWSQGKWVVDEVLIHTRTMNAEVYETIKFDYVVVGGIGLPEKIEIIYENSARNQQGKKTDVKEGIYFWDYKLNSQTRL